MTLDIRGSLKNTRVNQNQYVVIDELLSNAIDSFLIKRKEEGAADSLKIEFTIEFFEEDLIEGLSNIKITCLDNGAGFGEERTKAFVTKDTSYKDDLGIDGIGRCKGSGRIQFLHYFRKLDIDSVYLQNRELKRKTLHINESMKEVSETSFVSIPLGEAAYLTKVSLEGLKKDVREKILLTSSLGEVFSANALKHHVLVSFLQRFVSLKDCLGDFVIAFKTLENGVDREISLSASELPTYTSQKTLVIPYIGKAEAETFSVTHYKLSKDEFSLSRNTIAMCAKSAIVKDITGRYLKSKTLVNSDINGFYHIVLIESTYLDNHVNEQRDNFLILEELSDEDSFLTCLSYENIYDHLDAIIFEMVSPPDWSKDQIIHQVESKFGMSALMINEAKVRVRYGDTEESVVRRVMTAFQDEIIQDTSEIFDMKKQIQESDPNSDGYREKINNLAWKYTSSLKTIDMVNLSQLVVRRAAVIEILKLAVSKKLLVQNAVGRKNNESIIHQIFFPMRQDSNTAEDHDIWLLSEEYQYYSYISSDKSLASISWGDDKFFESDVDVELNKILEKNYRDNSAKRPDIAIFGKEGSVIIIEFKSPDENLDDHLNDLMEYAVLLCSKSKGKLNKVFGYLIGGNLNPNRMRGYEMFPNGHGWFATDPVKEHSTGTTLGELYSEILFYDDIVNKANMRLQVYKKRLNLSL